MGRHGKKRKHAQFTEDIGPGNEKSAIDGVASTLHVHQIHIQDRLQDKPGHQQAEEERTTLAKNGKQKKDTTYPALTYAGLHNLQSSLKLVDLQSLLLYCLADGVSPQWIGVNSRAAIKKGVVLFVPGLEKGMFDGSIPLEESLETAKDPKESDQDSKKVTGKNKERSTDCAATRSPTHKWAGPRKTAPSPDDYMPVPFAPGGGSLPESLKPLADIFKHLWPVKAPGDGKLAKVHSPLHAMLTVPLTKSQEEKMEEKKSKAGKIWDSKRTAITAFVASKEELRENEYTAHPAWFVEQHEQQQEVLRRQKARETLEAGWVDSLVDKIEDGEVEYKDIEQGSLTAGRSVLALDCEMCKVDSGEMALTRVSIVRWDGETVVDEFVKPDRPIVDYLTPYSGITAKKLAPVTTTLADIQIRLLELLTPQTIIIGHSLNSDLSALKMTHPFIVDTSILYQHPRGPPMKSSLKWLAQKYLSREIQKGHGIHGHDSIEDAKACLDLVKLKCERGSKWGTSEATGEPIFKRLLRSSKPGISSANGNEGRLGAIVDRSSAEKNFGGMASFCIGCESDLEVVQGIKRAVLGDPDGSTIPGGGVDFTWARLRDLESLRGWSRDNHKLPEGCESPGPDEQPSPAALNAAVAQTVQHIKYIRDFLPPCTLFIVYSGTGDPREMGRLQEMQRRFKKEYAVKKWDQLTVKWTDREEQALKKAHNVASRGLGFVGVV